MMKRRGPIPRQRRFRATGERLKNERERCQLTQSDIVDLLKEKGYAAIVPVTYRRWENGETSIPFEVVEILCKRFQLSAEELGLVEHRPHKGNVQEHVLLPKKSDQSVDANVLQQGREHLPTMHAQQQISATSNALSPLGWLNAKGPFLSIPTLFAPLLGRDQKVAEICHLLQHSEKRLLTLFGIGGVGKTRLALQVAWELRSSFADGVYCVFLGALRHPDLVVSTLAQRLGIQEREGYPITELVISVLREKHLLLVLDNFEQVIVAASHIQQLLVACPSLKVMVTSRIALRLPTEWTVLVPPLALPDQNQLFDYEVLSRNAAITLFVQCAQSVRPGFQVNQNNVQDIAKICACLDGLPLAIELAAARCKSLVPQELLYRLSQRFQILATNKYAQLPHQQTIWKTLTWSYDLLKADEQKLFRWLSVFAGGCSLKTIEMVFPIQPQSSPFIDLVESLIDHSLIKPVEGEVQVSRFVMLETLRAYGQGRLRENGEDEMCRNAHAAYFLRLTEQAGPYLTTKEQLDWLDRLEHDYSNVVEALSWLIKSDEIEKACNLCGALWRFWFYRRSAHDGTR